LQPWIAVGGDESSGKQYLSPLSWKFSCAYLEIWTYDLVPVLDEILVAPMPHLYS